MILGELRETIVEIVRLDLAQVHQRIFPVREAEARLILFKESRCDGGFARPGVFGEWKIAMLEPDRRRVVRKQFLIQHYAEIRAIRALEIFIDHHSHRALRRAFDQMLSRWICRHSSQDRRP